MTQSKSNCLLTICVPLARDPDFGFARDLELDSLIARLGNPVAGEPLKRLDATGIIHFISMHVISAHREGEQSFLLVEVSADGTQRDVIGALREALGEELLVIFRRGCGIADLDALESCLNRHSRRLSQSMFRFRAVPGLPFIGLDGLTVERINEEQELVEIARVALGLSNFTERDHLPPAGEYWKRARQAVDAQKPDWAKKYSDIQTEEVLPFVDSDDAPWLKRRKEPTPFDFLKLVPGLGGMLVAAILCVWQPLLWAMVGPSEWNWLAVLALGFAAIAIGTSLALVPLDRLRLSPGSTILIVVAAVIAWLAVLWWLADPGHWDFGTFAVVGVTTFAISLPLALVLLAAIGVVAYAALRASERRNKPNDLDPDPAVVGEMMRAENADDRVQNHMISVVDLVPEFYRRNVTLPFAMRTIETALKRRLFRGGFLVDIGTIHFARWVVLPRTNKLVFLSNYDGSWESYLEDFITKTDVGITGMWGAGIGFPESKRLFFEGAKDGDRFKRWARRSMQPTRFWYSAYPKLTAQQIRTNALICDGLRKTLSASDAEAWLELFDSIPRPEGTLQQTEIQKLVLSGLGELSEARCLALRFGETPNARNWLAELLEENVIVFANQRSHGMSRAGSIALSATGLSKLGMDGISPDRTDERDGPGTRFPAPLALGMHDESRRRILGDKHEDWVWGNGENVADAVLLLHAVKDKIDDVLCDELKRLKRFNIYLIHAVAMNDYQKLGVEPFKFVDGISQPVTRGFEGSTGVSGQLHNVEIGEFVLGYRDNRGYFPPSLLVPLANDDGDLLPSPPGELPKRWPRFRGMQGTEQATRDFGRNGSYLVIRQLEQHVGRFDRWLEDVTRELIPGAPEDVIKDHVGLSAAKVMGRWREGGSLIGGDKDTHDNDFLFGRDDPQGRVCPFGAHIRRANPRDSLNPGSESEIAIVNRHRLLRRGRPYKAENTEGILFMCFNADIERQFEFVQQNWINAPSHHGLHNEHDPVASHLGGGSFSMPMDFGPPKSVHRPKEAVVTVRGGGYFFAPSRSALCYLAKAAFD